MNYTTCLEESQMETSRPFPGTVIGDAGPYSAESWWDCWLAQSRAGGRLSAIANYDIGVFYAIANALEPASNVTEITVDTGASLIDGLYHENDASVAVPIPAATAAGDSRIDVIVVRKNYQQAVTYTPGGGAPTVPPRTARITVIRGAEAVVPVAPSLEQDTTRTTYWDIPIAQVQVDDAGALSGFTDLREFVDAETKTILLQGSGYNATDGAILFPDEYGYSMLGNKLSELHAYYIVPNDYISDMTITAVLRPGGAGNVYAKTKVRFAACADSYLTVALENGYSAVAVTVVNECEILVLNPVVAIGDIMSITVERNATNVLDTIGGVVYALGFKISYFGWKK